MKRGSIKTKIKDVVDYWSARVDECGLSVDWSEADSRCWRCGCQKNLERCHIVPDSLGGEDSPSNLVLLCKRCHAENPNVADAEIMWDWIRAYGVPNYETFWTIRGMQEYRFIYKKSPMEELVLLGITDPSQIWDEYLNVMDEVQLQASNHFGQPYLNSATLAGLFRMALKRLAIKRGKNLISVKEMQSVPRTPWWVIDKV